MIQLSATRPGEWRALAICDECDGEKIVELDGKLPKFCSHCGAGKSKKKWGSVISARPQLQRGAVAGQVKVVGWIVHPDFEDMFKQEEEAAAAVPTGEAPGISVDSKDEPVEPVDGLTLPDKALPDADLNAERV